MTTLKSRIYTIGLVPFLVAGPWAAQAATHRTGKTATTSSSAKTAKTIARSPYLGAIVLDAATGRVLFEDQADARGYPASVLKLMDLLIVLEKIEQQQFSFQDQVPVSSKAARTGGSQVW